MKKVIHKFRDMPVALTGLALGISGISGALSTFLGEIPIYIGDFISFFLVAVIFIKDCLHFDQLKNTRKFYSYYGYDFNGTSRIYCQLLFDSWKSFMADCNSSSYYILLYLFLS